MKLRIWSGDETKGWAEASFVVNQVFREGIALSEIPLAFVRLGDLGLRSNPDDDILDLIPVTKIDAQERAEQ